MSAIENLKHELQNRLREVLSANLVMKSVTQLGPFTAAPALAISKLESALRTLESERVALALSLKPGCDYFTLIRSVATLRKSIDEVRTSLDAYLEWAQSLDASGRSAVAEPMFPPSA